MDNSCKNCGECICLSCEIRDRCRCDRECKDEPLEECNRKIEEVDS
jgi:hypothetical protein